MVERECGATGPTRTYRLLAALLSNILFWFVLNALALTWVVSYHFSFDASSKPAWWSDGFALLTNVLAGGLVSFLFYFIVVFLPERRKKRIIKTYLKNEYRNIKRDILGQVVRASKKGGREDLSTDLDTVDRLMTIGAFRAAFRGGREANEGFYAFMNQMSDDTPEFRAIILSLSLFAKQIDYVLHNYGIEEQEAFNFLKRLETFLFTLQTTGPGYDESKQLCRFIYEIFSGFNWIDGDRGYDIIEKTIDAI